LWITRYLSKTYSTKQLKKMGWGFSSGGKKGKFEKLEHNGLTAGGTAYVVMFPEGYISADGRNLSQVHVAIATNTRPLKTEKNDHFVKDFLLGLVDLASKIAKEVPKAHVPSSYNIWGGFPEWSRFGVSEELYQYTFEHGYRPVWVDAYTVKGKTYFNVVFRPAGGVPWVAFHGLTADRYESEIEKWRNRGFRLAHVECYVQGGQIYYAAIFVKQSGPDWREYHGKTFAQHQQLFNAWTAQGYEPVNLAVATAGGTPRVAALYVKKGSGSVYAKFIPVEQYQKVFNQQKQKGRRLVYLNAFRYKGKNYFSAIWHSQQKGAYRARHNMSASKLNSEWRNWRNKGFLTRLITGYEKNQQHRFAAFWVKP
ncbi:MAG: hypothetical protein D6715_13210, partial [Calditrichaeota bacterium]